MPDPENVKDLKTALVVILIGFLGMVYIAYDKGSQLEQLQKEQTAPVHECFEDQAWFWDGEWDGHVLCLDVDDYVRHYLGTEQGEMLLRERER